MTEKLKRKPPNLHEKLGAVLLEYQRLLGDPLDREHMKKLSAREICSLFQWDHVVYHAWNGDTHPANLTPMLIAEHRTKTAKKDMPAIAKVRRALKKMDDERVELASTPRALYAVKKSKFPSRPMRKPEGKKYDWKKRGYR